VERCRRYVTAGARVERLVMFFNDVSVHTPTRNIHTAIAAIRHFGKLPIENRPVETFQPPEVESFESFMKRYRSL